MLGKLWSWMRREKTRDNTALVDQTTAGQTDLRPAPADDSDVGLETLRPPLNQRDDISRDKEIPNLSTHTVVAAEGESLLDAKATYDAENSWPCETIQFDEI